MDQQFKEQQDLYDSTWTGGLERGKEQRGNLQTNLEFLSRTGLLRSGNRVLEIGCGVGAVVSELAGQGCRVTGTDISRVAIEYGQSKYPGLDLQVQPAEELAFADETFDVVLSFDLFEHIARIDRHVSEVHRVLKSQGHYLFQTPNKLSNATFETLSHRSLKWRRYHPSLHTPGQIRRRLARHGFEVSFVKVNSINEFARVKLKKFGALGSLIGRINFEKLPLNLQTNLYVIARKRD